MRLRLAESGKDSEAVPWLQESLLDDKANQSHTIGGREQSMKTKPRARMELKQIQRPLPTEIDTETELIDLSTAFTSTSDDETSDDKDLIKLNERIIIEQPVSWWINESGGSYKIYKNGRLEGNNKGTSRYHQLCIDFPRDTSRLWRTVLGERVRPTQISSLLSQNLDDTTRSPNFCYKWDQSDEGYYKAKAKRGLAEHIANTIPDYYCLPESSDHRYLIKCPVWEKITAANSAARELSTETEPDDDPGHDDDNVDYGYGHFELPPPRGQHGDILIHVDPKTGQATYGCPLCTYNNKKIFGGNDYPVKHTISRDVRQKLAELDIIPTKEYKYKERTADRDATMVISVLKSAPHGLSSYQVDNVCGWPEKTTQRLVKKYLKDVVVERIKNGKKRLYLSKNQYAE